MPMTVDEYIEQAKKLIDHGEISETIEPTSAILYYGANSSMTGGGYAFLPDFGYLVCWLRYELTEQEFDSSNPPLWKYSEEELRQRRAAAEKGFDQLLEQFVQHGYQPEMGEQLLRIGADSFHEYGLDQIYVLPDDLDRALAAVGNPLSEAGEEDEEDDEHLTAVSIGFDLNNPEHRKKLAERLIEAGL